jgi:predicted ATPase/DNA-binding SARP family transcriptional activator
MLEVRLIGNFDIQCDGKSVTLRSRAAQSLLAYLILTTGTLHRREKLAGMFWPDEGEQKARTYLRNELWRIRKALPHTSKADYLLSDNLTAGFNPSSAYWLDVDALKNVSEHAAAAEIITGLLCYQGELLPGFYEEWIVLEREHLQVLFEQKMACLLETLEKELRWNDVLEWAERWISFGQGPEAAYRYLMIAYNALGDRAKVTTTYQRCVQALRELDLEPSEQTRALAFKQDSKIKVPIPLTSFIGREKELKEVAALFSRSRLITLTGSGGVGKTRLAIQVVAEVLDSFPDGVWFLDLAPLTDASLVPSTLANLLGLRESGEIAVTELLSDYFRTRTALVIFDNCEHLIEACAQLIFLLLTSCEYLSVVATSRETLRVSGEIPYRVPSLETPKPDNEISIDEISNMESVKLFVERAMVASPGYAINQQNGFTIAQICQRLGGIPLAIELAAAQVNILQVEEIWKQLNNAFALLAGGSRSTLARHQTLRSSMDWSWGLLSQAERKFLRQLSVFAGGWTLESAQAVCDSNALNLIGALVKKSLIVVNQEARRETRYHFHEIVRQYTHEKLVTLGEEQSIRTEHLKYFLQFSGQAEPALKGPMQFEWFARLDNERDNIRVALEWANETNVEAGLFIAGRLWRYWQDVDLREGERWLKKFLEMPESHNQPHARAQALYAYGIILAQTFQLALLEKTAKECLAIYRSLGDQYGELDGLITLARYQSATDDITYMELQQQASMLAESLGDTWRKAVVIGDMAWASRDLEKTIFYFKESASLSRKVGDLGLLEDHLSWLGNFEMLHGDLISAQEHLGEAAQLSQNPHRKGDMNFLPALSRIESEKGNFEKARTLLEKYITNATEVGNSTNYLWGRAFCGHLLVRQRQPIEARDLLFETTQEFGKGNDKIGVCFSLEGIAGIYAAMKIPNIAARLIGWADASRKEINDLRPHLEQADVDKIIATCIEKMGEATFSDAYKAGEKMTLEEAVALALKE